MSGVGDSMLWGWECTAGTVKHETRNCRVIQRSRFQPRSQWDEHRILEGCAPTLPAARRPVAEPGTNLSAR